MRKTHAETGCVNVPLVTDKQNRRFKRVASDATISDAKS